MTPYPRALPPLFVPRPRGRAIRTSGARVCLLMLAACGALSMGGPRVVAAQPGTGTSTTTTSTSSSQVLNDRFGTQRLDTWLTQIVGRVSGGPTVFDQSYAFAFGTGQVNNGVVGAQGALAAYFGANSYSSVGPTRFAASEALLSSAQGAPQVTGTTSTLGAMVEHAIGPMTIITGDRDRDGMPFEVLTGSTNVNINTHTTYDIFRTTTTTDTYQNVERYEIVATASPTTTVPEPGTWALTATGLVALGWRGRRRT